MRSFYECEEEVDCDSCPIRKMCDSWFEISKDLGHLEKEKKPCPLVTALVFAYIRYIGEDRVLDIMIKANRGEIMK